MRLRPQKNQASRLGRIQGNWFTAIVGPLNTRERILYASLIFAVVAFIVVPQVFATDTEVGQQRVLASSICAADGDWLYPERASGQSQQIIAAETASDINESAAIQTTSGALICGEFETNKDTKLSPAVLLSAQFSEKTITNEEIQLETGIGSIDKNQKINHDVQRIVANNFGEQATAASLDALVSVEISTNDGDKWQPLHVFESSTSLDGSSLVAIELPEILAPSIDDLSIRVTAHRNLDPVRLFIDSLGISYEIGEPITVEVNPVTETGDVLTDEQPALNADESLAFELKSKKKSDGFLQGLSRQAQQLVDNNQDPELNVETVLTHKESGKTYDVTPSVEWDEFALDGSLQWKIDLNMPNSLEPGAYAATFSVVNDDGLAQTLQQDFLWGVLSLNTNKSVYVRGETAQIAMTALDESGATICDATLALTIDKPGRASETYATYANTISKGSDCEVYGNQITPDYFTEVELDRAGTYDITLEATTENGVYSIADSFRVEASVPISVERIGPTRVYPPATYEMSLNLTAQAQEAVIGTFTERVPASFDINQASFGEDFYIVNQDETWIELGWDVELAAGEATVINYSFQAPPISPEFYLLGPGRFDASDDAYDFTEFRSWQLAGDALDDDFKIQSGVTTITGTSATITAGVDYDAPLSLSSAFIRINGTRGTASGDSSSGTQNSDDITAVINNPGNLLTSIDFTRVGAANDTRVAWEIIEYIGVASGANEFIVRDQGTSTYGTAALTVDTPTIAGVADDNDVVVWGTGFANPDTGSADFNTGQSTSEWVSASSVGRFTREEAGGDAVEQSWAVVEFTGSHWVIQRVENDFTSTAAETQTITAVNNVSRAFIYDQHRGDQPGLDDTGQEVWLNNTTDVNFQMQANSGNQFGVAWVIENTQTNGTPMSVERNTFTKANNAGSEPGVLNEAYGPISDLTVASVFANARSSGGGTALPRGNFSARLTTTSNIELAYSDNGQTQNGRWQVVEWPTELVANASTRQAHYQWRDDSTALNTAGGTLASEDSGIPAVDKATDLRLRIEVANVGTTPEAAARTYELQFAERVTSCSVASSWTGVADSADAFEMYDSTNISPDGQSTTVGLLANTESYTRINGSGQDVSDTTAAFGPLNNSEYLELEYAIRPTNDAVTGQTYCFRVFDTTAASTIDFYSIFPEVTIDSAITQVGSYGEAGTFTSAIDGGWTNVTFQSSYTTPVVVGTTNSQNGQNALVFESRNVTSTSADMRVCESEGATANGCDTHAAETVGYLVIDAAQASSIDGIEAGTFTADGTSDTTNVTVTYSGTFAATPLVFSNVNTVNDTESPTEVVIPSTSTTGFSAYICDHLLASNDACDTTHITETVGWVAIEPGNEPFLTGIHENGTSSISNSTWTPITFTNTYVEPPVVIVSSQTDAGAQDVEIDEARLVTATGAEIRPCEIDTLDTCDTHAGDTVAWAAFQATTFPATDLNLDLDGFRLYQNNNTDTPLSALEAENTQALNIADGDVIRLRAAVQIGTTALDVSSIRFKLQYVESMDCTTATGWLDTGGIGSGTIWRGSDNVAVTDGATLPSTLISDATTLGSYVEENNSPLNPNSVAAGDRGEWDFVIQNNGADPDTEYCFRLVSSDGQALHYTQYPSLKTKIKPIQQQHFRWRDDTTDLNTTGGWLAVEDSNAIGDRSKLETIRLRLEVANNEITADAFARAYELQYADLGNQPDCSLASSWLAVDANSVFAMTDTTHIDPNGEATTSSLLANAEGYSYTNGEGLDSNDQSGSIGPLPAQSYTELEYSIQPIRGAITGHTYCFRVYDAANATELDAYTVYPQLTLVENNVPVPIGEFGTATVTGTTWLTVNLTNTFIDPVVVASSRYAQTSSAVPERSVRVRNKTATTFQIKVDNHDATVTGTTVVDYIVFETGTHIIETGSGTTQVVADTHNTSTFTVCNAGYSGGDTVSYPTPFASAPTVLNTVVTDSDTSWVTSHVHGASQTTLPTNTQMRLGLDRSFESCTHGAEDIDYVAVEQTHDTHNSHEFEAQTTAASVSGGFTATGYSNNFNTAFAATPQVAVVAMQSVAGANGGTALIHTGGTALSTTAFNTASEELGTAADRAHAAEPIGILAFDSASGTINGAGASYDQDSYRWFDNEDSITPTVAAASENTEEIDVAETQVLRLRLGVQVGLNDLDASKLSLKLQFSSTATTCDAAASWTDVGAIGSGAIWRGFDNTTPADGATVPSSLINSGSNVLQSYVEENPSPVNPNIQLDGIRGEWDFVIENNSAVPSTTYCFRAVQNDGTQLVYTNYPQLDTAPPSSMILLFDGGSIPTNWTCISCTGGDDVIDRFIRGEAAYGATGGAATHTHTASATVAATSDPALGRARTGTLEIAEQAHTTTFTPTIDAASNLPAYRQLQVIQYDFNGSPAVIPNGAIALFDAAVPAGFTQYAAQNGSYARGQNTIGTTGGSNTHANTISGATDASGGGGNRIQAGGTQEGVAQITHTHDGSGVSTTVNNEPPYIEVILAQSNSDIAIPDGLIAMWNDTPSGDWSCVSCTGGDPLYQRFFKPAAAYGTTGGNATHTHSSVTYASGPPIETTTTRDGTVNASSTHTHGITVDTYSTDSHLPPYIDVIFSKYSLNAAPDVPSGLDQKQVASGSSIAVNGWANDNSVRFDALVSDSNNPDTLELCIEVKPVTVAFIDIETACSIGFAVAGSAVTATLNIAGLAADTEYHWQARVRDADSAYSAWVSFGGNSDVITAARDFAIDTTAPTGTVYDGTTLLTDIDYNDGTLDELSANWSIDSSISGLVLYEYSVGTTPAATDVLTWTSNGTSNAATATSLTLNTSQPYYFNVRTTDTAGNQSTISSDGIFVAPTLSFSTSPGSIDFDNLNSANNYTDTKTATLTTSTNAYNGYTIKAYLDGVLTSNAGATIPGFDGGSYASPDEWLPGDVGYGFTSNDTTIQGADIFNSACLGGGSPPCYTPFSTTAPGDIVADHTSLIAGTPVTNENFLLTHRVTVNPGQAAGRYTTIVIYIVTATY